MLLIFTMVWWQTLFSTCRPTSELFSAPSNFRWNTFIATSVPSRNFLMWTEPKPPFPIRLFSLNWSVTCKSSLHVNLLHVVRGDKLSWMFDSLVFLSRHLEIIIAYLTARMTAITNTVLKGKRTPRRMVFFFLIFDEWLLLLLQKGTCTWASPHNKSFPINDLFEKLAQGPPRGISPSSLLKERFKSFEVEEFLYRSRNNPR